MRSSATIIAVFAFLLVGCGFEPTIPIDIKKQLNDLKGPETGTIEGSLKQQADAAVAVGDYVRGAEIDKQLVDKYPDKNEYLIDLADNLRRGGDSITALKVLDVKLDKDPSNAALLESKGLCLINTGDFAEAGKTFGEVMKHDSKRWRTLNGIGILFAMKGMEEDAMAYYDAALNVNPHNPSVLNNKALTLAMDKQYDKAVTTFDLARHHLEHGSPEIKSIDLNLALIYAIQGKLDDAEQLAAPHLSKAALYNNMGFYAYLAKNSDLAKGYLNMALIQSPVYYERAWKNLNALNGEPAEQGSDTSTDNDKFSAFKVKPKTFNLDSSDVPRLSAKSDEGKPVASSAENKKKPESAPVKNDEDEADDDTPKKDTKKPVKKEASTTTKQTKTVKVKDKTSNSESASKKEEDKKEGGKTLSDGSSAAIPLNDIPETKSNPANAAPSAGDPNNDSTKSGDKNPTAKKPELDYTD